MCNCGCGETNRRAAVKGNGDSSLDYHDAEEKKNDDSGYVLEVE